jgi:hypothetical protein
MSKINILAIPPDNHGVGKFRILTPYKHLQENYPDDFQIEIVYNVPDSDEFFSKYEIIVAHSFIHNKVPFEKNIERIEWLKRQGKIVILDTDDLWKPDMRHPMYHYIMKTEIDKKKMALLKSASYVTTTTPVYRNTLKNRLGLNNVVVFPNAIDETESQYIPNPIKSDKIRFGWLGGSCLTSDTEILTDFGWKYFEDLNRNEKVATLNQKTNEIEYYKPHGYIKEKYDGEILVCNTNQVSFAVTPNHNMYASIAENLGRKKLNFELITAENIFNKNFHVKKNGINTNCDIEYFILPEYKTSPYDIKDYNAKKILMDDWLKFFGFFLAEGWTDSRYAQVGICQYKKTDYLKTLYEILSKYDLTPKFVNENIIRMCHKQLHAYLKQFGKAHEKFIPRELLNTLSQRQLSILLEWYLMGDGSFDKTGNYIRRRGYTVSAQLANDLTEIAFKTGDCSSLKNRGKRIPKSSLNEKNKERKIFPKFDAYQIGFYCKDSKHNKLNPLIKKNDIKKEFYSGYIYCVNVTNNIIYIRRNGKPLWIGNSHMHDVSLLQNGIWQMHDYGKDKVQFVLCGFDLRGEKTEVDKNTGQTKSRPILPEETVWYEYEKIFTKNYSAIPIEYANFLKTFKQIEYPDENMPYRRRWTMDINKYATNYNYFDVSMAPIVDTEFNVNKSPLKAVECGFHKKALIASETSPYTIDLINLYDKGGTINPKGNALLVNQAKNHKQWFQHMKKLFDNPNMIEDLGNKLYETVKIKYSLNKVNKDRAEFLKSIINK